MRIGSQLPSFEVVPPFRTSAGEDVIDMAAKAGMPLDDWQQHIARNAFGERPDGKWSAFECALVVPRQNGKSALIEAMILAALFIWRERTIVYSAHKFDSAQETFLRLRSLIEDSEFADEVASIPTANGKEAIVLRSGARVKFKARSKGAARGFTGDRIIFDEAYDLPTKMLGNMIPALAARSQRADGTGPQVWYASSAAHADSVQLWSLTKRAMLPDPGKLYYAEWRAPDGVADDDVDAWYGANPALGIRISEEFVRDELQALSADPDEFRRERLGIPDPLPPTDEEAAKLPAERWAATITDTPAEVVPGACVLAYDVHNNTGAVCIATGTLSSSYVEITDHRSGDAWLPARLVDLAKRWQPVAIGMDSGNGPAAAILGPIREAFEDAGLDPDIIKARTGREYRDACGGFFEAVVNGTVRRPRVSPDNLELAGAKCPERVMGDAFVWDRRCAPVPISSLVAATVARSLLAEKPPTERPFFFA